jgi:protein transport protein SEC61 subunit gamma-like protein
LKKEMASQDTIDSLLDEPRMFVKESIQLLNRCTKPDQKEYFKIAQAVTIGFFVMGFIGFFVKLIHIPINNIIVHVYWWGGDACVGVALRNKRVFIVDFT